MKKILFIIVTIALIAFLVYAVTYQRKTIPVDKPGTVSATKAYEQLFGVAPSVDKGTAYAFVIYFPSAKTSGKVVPFPFFTFDEGSIQKVAVERLLAGMDTGSYQGEFVPFPSGIRLLNINDQGSVVVDFNKELGESSDKSVVYALALTLRQFKGVKDIRIQVDGKDSPSNALLKELDGNVVLPLSSPRILALTAMRDKGVKDVEEVNLFFDRPVVVKEMKLFSKEGHQFEGEMYHSVFDMAAVFKPKTPGLFKERMPVRAQWKVIDKLGRSAEGDSIMLLEVKEH
ncbi:MAG: sporulation protein [Geobacter sp.]|nr:sporulation protein [Geobacter sp.]